MDDKAFSDWPGPGRRHPGWGSPTYAILEPLALWLREEARAAHAQRGPFRLLDVGCGVKPYYPFFHEYVSEYVGVDEGEGTAADIVGSIDAIPVPDASFDVVLCTQVLEHVPEPARAVGELRRVTAPGGRVLASTHGVQVYHPAPEDYWRWTHTGLERLFRQNGDWEAVTVTPSSGTAACLGALIAIYVDLLGKRTHTRPLTRGVVAGVNVGARALDRRSKRLRYAGPGSLHLNYHVVADAPG
jgi:SAM-dependent methyltransferase